MDISEMKKRKINFGKGSLSPRENYNMFKSFDIRVFEI